MNAPPLPPRRSTAFTLVELLVVVGIIVLLIGLLFSSLGEFRRQAAQTACLSNQRQIALAAAAYASDNNGRLPCGRTAHLSYGSPPDFVNMWVDTAVAGGTIAGRETIKSLEAGVMWSYLGQNAAAYKSPQDPEDPTKRIRSYSLNSFVGSGERSYNNRCDDSWDFPHSDHPQTPTELKKRWYRMVTIAQIPQPSRTMYTISEEDRYGFNLDGFTITIHPSFNNPLFGEFIDTPATWNGSRVNMSYMDGSVEAADILYPSLVRQFNADADSHWVIEGGGRPAFKYLSDRMLPGYIRQALQ